MQTYKNFNRDQINVLGTQLSMVIDELTQLEDSLAGDAQLTLDFGEFTGAIATLTTVLRKANVRPIKKATEEAHLQAIKPRSGRPQPQKSNFACCNPNCRGKKHCARGLCHSCYSATRKKVAEGELSWEQLESAGRSKPAKNPPKRDKVALSTTPPEDTSPPPLNQAV